MTKADQARDRGEIIPAEVAAPYCEKYRVLPTLTLARLIYKENSTIWPNLDACRQCVSRIRGKHGKKNRVGSSYSGLFDEEERTRVSPFALPKSWAHPTNVYKIPKQYNNIGFISDAQVPFQDNQAIECAYGWLKSKNINALFINGDWVDFYKLSNFEKDPRRRNFPLEYHSILQSLEHMRHHFPDIPIFYNLDANHEIRYERYMMSKAPELLSLDLPEFGLETLLKLSVFDITPLRNNHHILIGKLPVLHGHTLFKGTVSSVSTARTVYMKTKMSTIASHCHQVNEWTTTKINGEMITCWTNGCLMDLNVEYNQHGNNYAHGVTRIETDSDDTFRVENKRIQKGVVL